MQDRPFIIDATRTPIGKLKGALSPVRADDLAAHAIKSLVEKQNNLDPSLIEDVILGCANQAGEDNRNVARMASLLAGLPVNVTGETVNRLCASGMSAVVHACRAIIAGDGDCFIAGGVEHMTRSPLVMSKSSSPFGGDVQVYDSTFGWRFVNPKMHEMYGTDAMGMTAENLAELYNIDRNSQDLFAVNSQLKASKAQSNGRFAAEISPLTILDRKSSIVIDKDEFIKPDTTIEALANLRPAFKKDGTVTAGNASGLNDGAAAMLITSESFANKHNLSPIARYLSSAVSGVEPRIMGIGPVEASKKALLKAGLTLDQMDVIEINEAFAAQVLSCTRQLGLADDDARINPNGGAIALGHPLGMSGTRILQTAAIQLQQSGGKYALVTMCIGLGQGYATVIEKV
jgi:acetyl-CoA acyltransferase